MNPLLILGATLRLTRVITDDYLGQWWIKDPIDRAAGRWADREYATALRTWDTAIAVPAQEHEDPWWWKYRAGLDCAWCSGFWVALGTVSLTAATNGTRMQAPWRGLMGALTVNYVAAQIDGLLDAERNSDEH